MNEIEISSDEKSSRILSQVNLERSLYAIKNDGYVIISNAVSHEHLDKIGHQMDKDAQKLIAAEQWSGAGGLPGHLILGPPRSEALLNGIKKQEKKTLKYIKYFF